MHETGALPLRRTTERPQILEKRVHWNIMELHKGKYQHPVTGEEQHQALIHTGGQMAETTKTKPPALQRRSCRYW